MGSSDGAVARTVWGSCSYLLGQKEVECLEKHGVSTELEGTGSGSACNKTGFRGVSLIHGTMMLFLCLCLAPIRVTRIVYGADFTVKTAH